MSCSCCSKPMNSGMIIKADKDTGARYKSCPHCTEANGSMHVFHRYPLEFGFTPARKTARNPDGHQSYCKDCRSKAKGEASTNYANGVTCSDFT